MCQGETLVSRLSATAREPPTLPGPGTVIIESGMVDCTPLLDFSSAGPRRIRDTLAFCANNAISGARAGGGGAKMGIVSDEI